MAGIVTWAEQHLFERRSVVHDHELMAAALERGRGMDFNLDDLRQAIDQRGLLREKDTDKLTSREVLGWELEVVVAAHDGRKVLAQLWAREMAMGVYDPKWLACQTAQGPVRALAFTLSRKSPSHTGVLTPEEYRRIFMEASGIYGTTYEYAHRTLEELRRHDIQDRGLEKLLRLIDRNPPS